jgi:hypothetical protein
VNLPAKELLSSDLGDDGLWHARYPSASKTLCGQTAPERKRGRRVPPDCGKCGRAARMFDRIDRSMPNAWREA